MRVSVDSIPVRFRCCIQATGEVYDVRRWPQNTHKVVDQRGRDHDVRNHCASEPDDDDGSELWEVGDVGDMCHSDGRADTAH